MFGKLRTWMNEGAGKWVTALVALAAIAGAGVWIYQRAREDRTDALGGRQQRVLFVCRKCSASGELRMAYGAEWPQPCPQCGAPEAVQGIHCLGCRRIIALGDQPAVSCPHCGRVHDERVDPQIGPGPAPPTR